MTDQEAIAWMKASPCPEADGCELCSACAHAVDVIEKMQGIRELLAPIEIAHMQPKGFSKTYAQLNRDQLKALRKLVNP